MAAEGKNKVALSLLDLQPTAVLELFRVFPDRVNLPNLFLGFHGGSNFDKSITWQGVDYLPLAIETEGFDILGDGKLARPKIKVANRNNIITNFLQNYKDLINAKFVRKRVQVKFLDDSNFQGGNPFGAADSKAELTNETWIMGRKTQESKIFVEFELNSPLDLENFSVNSRNVVAKFCGFQYRGEGCRYAGFPVEKDDGYPFKDADGVSVVPQFNSPTPVDFFHSNYAEWTPNSGYSKGDIVWVKSPTINVPPVDFNPNDDTVYPLKTVYVAVSGDGGATNSGKSPANNPSYWQKDGCSKKLGACRKRFNASSHIEFIGGTVTNKTFPSVRISGTTLGSARSEDVSHTIFGQPIGASAAPLRYATNTGFFHSNELTGKLTGNFTLMGFANVRSTSPSRAGIFSSSKQADVGVWPSSRYVNMGIGMNRGIQAEYFGYRISPTSNSSRRNIYQRQGLTAPQRLTEDDFEVWNQYVITHGRGLENGLTASQQEIINGEGENAVTQINFYVNGEQQGEPSRPRKGSNKVRGADILNRRVLGNFGSLAERKAAAAGWPASLDPDGPPYGPLPNAFMIGGVEYYGYDDSSYEQKDTATVSCINGHIATWALWNRVLSQEEIDFLRVVPVSNDLNINTVNIVPRTYAECTGLMSTLTGGTGDGLPAGSPPLLYGHDSLIAWWDGTTGDSSIGNGLVDIHTGGYHLTGSGSFSGFNRGYYEGNPTRIPNPTPNNPRFGGFPGTDGFSYGRNTSI